MKLKMSSFILDIRKKLFTMKLLRHWNRLLRVVDAPSLEVFEARLDGLVKGVPEHVRKVRTG